MNTAWCWIVAGVALCASFGVMLKNAPDRQAVDAAVKPLLVPERQFAYGREDMEAFIARANPSTLRQYAETVLKWDALFAVLFALGIALAAIATLVTWFDAHGVWLKWPLLTFCSWAACMALLYGAADVAEDYVLRRIIEQSLPHRLAGMTQEGLGVDMAQVDAANVLTRMKIVTLSASVAGGGLWFAMSFVAGKVMWPRAGTGDPDKPSPEMLAG